VDSLGLPSRLRKGVPTDVEVRLLRATAEEQFGMVSSLWGLYPLPSRALLLAHLDLTLHPGFRFPVRAGERLPIHRRLFISTVSLDRRAVCPDAEIPISGEVTPALSMRGDTLLVLDQSSDTPDAPLVILKFRVRDDHCRWRSSK
jgi:hypothetical protein